MAQTKAKPRSPGQRSRGPKKSKQTRSQAKSKLKSPSVIKPKGLIDKSKAAGETVEETAKDAGRAMGKAVGKAKVPLMAGGAALAGAAGGIALSRQGNRHRGLAAMKPKINSKDLAKAARKATDVGAQVGEIALEVRRVREASNGKVRRSPVEVVLEGLTSRHTSER